MARTALAIICLSFVTLLTSCSQADQERAHQKAAEAKAKAREDAARLNQDAKRLGHQVKEEAHVLNAKLGNAVNGRGQATNGASEAEQKVARGAGDLRVETDKAGVKLDHAALIAKVKTKLASEVGLSTVTGVVVDTSGQVVTLTGTVHSPEQKQQAEQAALQVRGVSRVINNLTVQP